MVYKGRTYPAKRKDGYRSGLEARVARELEKSGYSYEYETTKVPYTQPAQGKKYLIDFTLGNGIAIEAKGEFTSADRKKHLLIKEQWPDLDLRFVFSNPHQKLSKKSKTTYAGWCEQHGFLWAKGSIPESWVREPKNARSVQSIKQIKQTQSYKGGKIHDTKRPDT